MSEWSERFRNSPVWKALEDLGPAIDNAEAREGIELHLLEHLARTRAVLTFIGKRITALDPLLVQGGVLDSVSTHLTGAQTEIQSFTSNGSPGHLVNANSHMDSALAYTCQLNLPVTPPELQGLRDSAEKYRNSMERGVRGLATSISTVTQQIATVTTQASTLAADMSAERQRLTSMVSDFQSQFSAAQESRSTEYASAQTSRQERFNEQMAASTEALTKQDAAFTTERERLIKAHEEVLRSLEEGSERTAAGLLVKIDKHRQDVEKLVGVIGNLGVTSGYLKTANEAKVTVRIWQFVAVASMIGLIIVAYMAFLPVIQGTFSWEGFAGRVFFTITIGVLAGYAASQADKFMSLERRNRARALELEALGPYLSSLPVDKQQEFRLALGEKTFGHFEGLDDAHAKSPATVVDVLLKSTEFRAFVTDIVKAARGPQ